jgi:hypothetical protein
MERRQIKFSDEIGYDQILERYQCARGRLNEARIKVANVKPRDSRELVLKSRIAATFQDGKHKYLRAPWSSAK